MISRNQCVKEVNVKEDDDSVERHWRPLQINLEGLQTGNSVIRKRDAITIHTENWLILACDALAVLL